MNVLERIRKGEDGIVVLGNHPGIIQSILDFDYLSGKSRPSIVCIVSGNRKSQKFFFGTREILIPCVKDIYTVPDASRVQWMLNVQSGRRVFESTVRFFETFTNALGGHVFAENVPEQHATELIKRFGKTKVIAGPSGVGILVPGFLKLGAIGGIGPTQIQQGKLTVPGSIAVISTSGGMTNELIVATAPVGISFSISIGGDRFPITSLEHVLSLAQNDPATKGIVYFGELGGVDEYEIVELIEKRKLTKPLVAYIAGIIDEAFDEHVQFGHAKALVAQKNESARAKRDALSAVGAIVPETFPSFLDAISKLPHTGSHATVPDIQPLMNREKSILSTREIIDLERVPQFVKGKKLLSQEQNAFARAAASALLDRDVSDITAAFIENVFELLIDHGGNVSGAVNTMITARAGKDMVSSLASGLLTIGPRFGGAVNDAARTWLEGTASKKTASDFVEEKTRAGALLSGIGHRKYRVGIPDPRVAALSEFATLLKKHAHYDFAREIEKVTTGKNGSLILNVDGIMAALLIDILIECEGYSPEEIRELADAEFFNALFIVPRTVGFIAHYIEQKKNDEGLFRLPDELLFVEKKQNKSVSKKTDRRKR
jgi:ATP citrate (pro-S)-lyase